MQLPVYGADHPDVRVGYKGRGVDQFRQYGGGTVIEVRVHEGGGPMLARICRETGARIACKHGAEFINIVDGVIADDRWGNHTDNRARKF